MSHYQNSYIKNSHDIDEDETIGISNFKENKTEESNEQCNYNSNNTFNNIEQEQDYLTTNIDDYNDSSPTANKMESVSNDNNNKFLNNDTFNEEKQILKENDLDSNEINDNLNKKTNVFNEITDQINQTNEFLFEDSNKTIKFNHNDNELKNKQDINNYKNMENEPKVYFLIKTLKGNIKL